LSRLVTYFRGRMGRRIQKRWHASFECAKVGAVKPQRRPASNPVSPAKARSIAVAKRPRGRGPGAVHGPDIAAALRQVMALCATATGGKPLGAGRSKRLDALFRDLLKESPPRDAEETGDLIWALWTNHDDAAATDAMQKAIGLIVAKETAPARAALDALCDLYPDWAEAWNKRATLAFIELRDADAVADIIETLARAAPFRRSRRLRADRLAQRLSGGRACRLRNRLGPQSASRRTCRCRRRSALALCIATQLSAPPRPTNKKKPATLSSL